MADYYLPGGHNKICDRSGFKIKNTEAVKEWNGRIVRRCDYEPRHPQDRIRGRKESIGVKDARPRQAPHFLAANEVTRNDL